MYTYVTTTCSTTISTRSIYSVDDVTVPEKPRSAHLTTEVKSTYLKKLRKLACDFKVEHTLAGTLLYIAATEPKLTFVLAPKKLCFCHYDSDGLIGDLKGDGLTCLSWTLATIEPYPRKK